MRSLSFYLAVFLLLGGLFIGCNNDDDHRTQTSASVNDFVWKAMNLWYYWQDKSPTLADDAFANTADYQQFLNTQNTRDLFNNLLYQPGQTDRFSWIVEDYKTLNQQFAGINKSFGMSYGLVYQSANSDKIFGYVRYVLPNSAADLAGMKRGDLFTRINETPLTDYNYQSLLDQNTAIFGMAKIEEGILHDLNIQIPLTQTEIQENPVHLYKVLEVESQKIGYLLYNGFRSNFNDELNEAIGHLKSQNIQDFVIDLRYNGGGSVQTATYLASMITGQFNQQDFSRLYFNQKASQNNSVYSFSDHGKTYDDDLNENGNIPLNHLHSQRLFVLTSSQTASASEMLISCLQPYIDVYVIGQRTYGKTVGSITLYDSPQKSYTSPNGVNPNHTWALQPIVFEYQNALDQSSPSFGIEPMSNINEIHYLEALPPLGDEEDPLLAAALQYIAPGASKVMKTPMSVPFQVMKIDESKSRFSTEMYLEKGFEFIP